jgi:predicted TIM-barrel fold metal-dependent hydrolase
MASVIDFHTHLLPPDLLNETVVEFLRRTNPGYYREMRSYSEDPGRFAAYLRSQGIAYAVVLPEFAPAVSCSIPTREVIEFCRSEPMLIPFVSVNPNTDPDPPGLLEHYVREEGARGLKLLPSYQFFYPNEARLYPLYAKAQELGVPVVFHVGSSVFRGTRLKYCDPIYLDDVAVDFPGMPVVMAHSGRGFWYLQCFSLSRLHPRVYMDITGLPPGNLLHYFPDLDKNGDNVVFGSDWPPLPVDIERNIQAIRDLPLNAETVDKILYRNAASLLFGEGGGPAAEVPIGPDE